MSEPIINPLAVFATRCTWGDCEQERAKGHRLCADHMSEPMGPILDEASKRLSAWLVEQYIDCLVSPVPAGFETEATEEEKRAWAAQPGRIVFGDAKAGEK